MRKITRYNIKNEKSKKTYFNDNTKHKNYMFAKKIQTRDVIQNNITYKHK